MLLSFISKNIDVIIAFSGLIIAVLLILNSLKLAQKESAIKEALNRRNSKYAINSATRGIDISDDEDAAITPDTVREFESQFNKATSLHDVLAQLIPVFPMLGILGTVAGLMLSVKAGDISSMMASLDTALSSTYWGLIAAIILKVIDSVFPAKIIRDVEIMLDDFDRKIDLANLFQRTEKK